MQPETIEALIRAYVELQKIVADLYNESQAAFERERFPDASLLQAKADRLFEETINFEAIISDLEE